MKYILPVCLLLFAYPVLAQQQACPPNSNFGMGDLNFWGAYVGNNQGGNGPSAIKDTFSSALPAPAGTIGATGIDEYQLPGTLGIQVLTASGIDRFGGFSTIPNINGYRYTNSVLLGSTSITRGGGGVAGGYVRGIKYQIAVPTSVISQPYTMTYAYAMVLENGTHNSINQPLFSATLQVHDSVITCASPKYFLPTLNNANNGTNGATLDSATAIAEGFTVSNVPSPNMNTTNGLGGYLQDVWWKGWTEVTFDLSPFRGDTVTLTFEADNCVPGGHFAYAYVALRNICDGLLITGDTVACIGTKMTYAIPGLGGATYSWAVPSDWTISSGAQTNILSVISGSQPGYIAAREINGCADLRDTLKVSALPPTIPGSVSGNAEVCSGTNSSPLTESGYLGTILEWVASTDGGASWTTVGDLTPTYIAQNLTKTTMYKAVVQDGEACQTDSSTGATIQVDPRSVGGQLQPQSQIVCANQFKGALLNLNGYVGTIQNWQSATDTVNWSGVTPVDTGSLYNIVDIPVSMQYRVLVKSGVCPVDTSTIAFATLVPGLFPQAAAEPADTTICYGTTASLNAVISLGTNYSWTDAQTLTNEGNGTVGSTPFAIHALATPLQSTDYVLSVMNTGCPNVLLDTMVVNVMPQIIVNAGNDTAIVFDEPLQLNATANQPNLSFTWSPETGLNNPGIPNPVALLGINTDSMTYLVKAMSATGCYGLANLTVKVFKTGPDIFVPNAFTPGLATNSVFRPVPVGVSSIEYFRVYNRWGQLVYSTSTIGQGWDGSLNGKIQDPDTYVWMVKGTSYTGKTIFKKGFMVLVR